MTFNIATFNEQVGGTLVPNNLYSVQIQFPIQPYQTTNFRTMWPAFALSNAPSLDTVLEQLTWRCVGAALPGQTVRTTEINRHGVGVREKMPFAPAYTDVPLTLFADNRNDLTHQFWKAWMEYVATSVGHVNGRTAYTIEYKDNFSATIIITTYNLDGSVNQTHYLYEAYPIAINDANVSWNNMNSLLIYNVTLTFINWGFTNASDGSGD